MTARLPDANELRKAASYLNDAGNAFHTAAGNIIQSGRIQSWDESASDSYRQGAARLATHVGGGESPSQQVAGSLRTLANIVDSVSSEHASLVRQKQDITSKGVGHDVAHLLTLNRLDNSIASLESRISVQAAVTSQLIDELSKQATLAGQAAHENSFWTKVGQTFVDSTKDVYHFGKSMAEGTFAAVSGMATLAWKLNPTRLEFDPLGYTKDVESVSEGFYRFGDDLIHHPGNTLYKTFDIKDLKHDPGKWIGEQLPAIAIGLATGGLGSVAVDGGGDAGLDAVDDAATSATDAAGGSALRTTDRLTDLIAQDAPDSAKTQLLEEVGVPDDLAEIPNDKVRKALAGIWEGAGADEGDGSTMAALKREAETGDPLKNGKWHIQKMVERRNALASQLNNLTPSAAANLKSFIQEQIDPVLDEARERLSNDPNLPSVQKEFLDPNKLVPL